MERKRSALLLGTFIKPSESIKNYFVLTENSKILDKNLKGALLRYLVTSGQFEKDCRIKLFHPGDPTATNYVKNYDQIAIVNLGLSDATKNTENININIENIIDGIVFALKFLKSKYYDQVHVDSCGYPKAVGTAVAFTLPTISYVKCVDESNFSVKYFDEFRFDGEIEYQKGIFLGKGQIVAQQLMKSSSVQEFVRKTKSFLGEFDVEIVERSKTWLQSKNMNSLLSTAKNSEEQPVLLEIVLKNSEHEKPLVLVAKATPYESSLFPLSNKPELHQFQYRSGMGGASAILGSMYSLCLLQASVSAHCIIAVVWNKLHDKPNKKGDVVQTMNGTSIQIDSPEAEGRLIMADILCYADTLSPRAVLDVATLSSNIESLLGNSYISFFTSDEKLREILNRSSLSSGEKVWQLPLYYCFRKMLKVSDVADADISNVGKDEKSVTACKSASFLQAFVKDSTPWIHLDISAVSECRGKKIYLGDWATGRSTRLVAEFCSEYFNV